MRTFDGLQGRETLARLVASFLTAVVNQNVEGAGGAAAEIFQSRPGDPSRRVGPDFLIEPWRWAAAVSSRAGDVGDHVLCARIGLMTEIWNRRILKDDPRYQFGRLVNPPAALEQQIYTRALRSLAQMEPDKVVVPGGEQGWTASEAMDQLVDCVETMVDAGESVGAELLSLARGGARFATPPGLGDRTRVDPADGLIDAINLHLAEAEDGDLGSDLWVRATYIMIKAGDKREALGLFEKAARLGHVDAMFDAGCVASQLEDLETAAFWWSAAADAGKADGSWNLAALATQRGDVAGASTWFRRTADLGDNRGYRALTQMAQENGDNAAERHWARLGAEAGEPHCLFRHGLALAMDAQHDPEGLRRARPYLELGAEKGDVGAMGMAANVNDLLGERSRSRHFAQMVVQTGDAEAIDRLRRYGLL